MVEHPLAIAVAARPYPGETVNGDAWQVDWDGDVCRIAVVDGLGHGPQAAAAALAATTHLADHPGRDPAAAVQGCHEALTGIRGAALLVARIDVGSRTVDVCRGGERRSATVAERPDAAPGERPLHHRLRPAARATRHGHPRRELAAPDVHRRHPEPLRSRCPAGDSHGWARLRRSALGRLEPTDRRRHHPRSAAARGQSPRQYLTYEGQQAVQAQIIRMIGSRIT